MEPINPTVGLALVSLFIGEVALLMSYYAPGVRTPLWTEAYRKYRGHDHIGFVLEMIFLVLAGAALGAVGMLEPTTSARSLLHAPRAGYIWAILAITDVCVYIVLMRENLPALRRDASERIADRHARVKVLAVTSDRAIVRQYRVYIVFAVMLVSCLALATMLFLLSAIDNVAMIKGLQSRLISGFSEVHRTYLMGGDLNVALRAAFLRYGEFFDIVVHGGTRAILAAAFLLLPATWMLWEPAQELYLPATIAFIRHYACGVLLMILPTVVCYTYWTVGRTWETVETETDDLGSALAHDPGARSGVGELLSLKVSMMGDISPRGLLERLAFNAGIFVFAGQIGFSVIQRRQIKKSFWSNLLPDWVKRILRLMDIARIT